MLDAEGRSDFGARQRALGGRGGKRVAGAEVILYAFDLLYLDRHDVSGMALDERWHLLEDLVRDRTDAIRLSEKIIADGAELMRMACRHAVSGAGAVPLP